jgi:hypothetical protein
MDGRVLEEIFTADYLQKNPPEIDRRAQDTEAPPPEPQGSTFEDDEQTIRKQLRDLGYM